MPAGQSRSRRSGVFVPKGETRLRKAVSRLLPLLLALSTIALPAHAHVGSKDVFEQVISGPYKFFVTIRPPTVVPGIATVEVRVEGPALDTLEITPIPLTGEASLHPPAADPMRRSPEDPAFFTGSLWLMASGSWQVRLHGVGAGGAATASVPVPAMALGIQRMQRPLGLVLAFLGLVLVIGLAGIIYGAVREARLIPGRAPTPARQYRATLASAVTLVLLLAAVYLGDKWWNVEAADYSANIFRPLSLHTMLAGNALNLRIDREPTGKNDPPDRPDRRRANDDLLPDHGHLMHLYAIRWPEMDAVYHLHPNLAGPGELLETLPSMPPGTYHLYADIVHRNGFPETLTGSIDVPPDTSHLFLDSEDASAYPAPLSRGDLGSAYKLPDGYTMVWDRPAALLANKAELFRFRLLDPQGKPATGMRPYLGMAGHAAFVKSDGTVFAHTHPDGSAAMPAMMLANANTDAGMTGMGLSDAALRSDANADANSPANTGMGGINAQHPAQAPKPLAPVVEFPYGFPSAGRYRIFIQMKHSDTVETGVFDAEVK